MSDQTVSIRKHLITSIRWIQIKNLQGLSTGIFVIYSNRNEIIQLINSHNAILTIYSGGKCEDKNKNCPSWAKDNQCELAPDPVIKTCLESCGICKKPCADDHKDCKGWAEYGLCFKRDDVRTVGFMLSSCRLSCGVCTPGTLINFVVGHMWVVSWGTKS